jgi:hypothetical protein
MAKRLLETGGKLHLVWISAVNQPTGDHDQAASTILRIVDPWNPEPELREMAGPIQPDNPKTIEEAPKHSYSETVKHIEWSTKTAEGTDDPDIAFARDQRTNDA